MGWNDVREFVKLISFPGSCSMWCENWAEPKKQSPNFLFPPLPFLSPPLLPLSSSPSSLLLPFLSPPLPFFLSSLQPSPVAPGGSGGTSGPPTSGQPSFKLSVPESLDRVKEEFSYLQAQTTKWVKVFVIKFEYNALLMRVKGVLLMW